MKAWSIVLLEICDSPLTLLRTLTINKSEMFIQIYIGEKINTCGEQCRENNLLLKELIGVEQVTFKGCQELTIRVNVSWSSQTYILKKKWQKHLQFFLEKLMMAKCAKFYRGTTESVLDWKREGGYAASLLNIVVPVMSECCLHRTQSVHPAAVTPETQIHCVYFRNITSYFADCIRAKFNTFFKLINFINLFIVMTIGWKVK